MALLKVASSSRSGLSPTFLRSFTSQAIWRTTEWSTNLCNSSSELTGGEGAGGQQLQQQRQRQRGFAKDAVAPKTATPNPAKNVKAKNATKKEEKKEQRDRFTALIDACLDAPPPVTVLKEKERQRLLEREKLGIVSPKSLAAGIGQQQQKARGKAAAAKKEKKEEREKVKAKPVVEQEGDEDGRRAQDLFVSTEMAEMAEMTEELELTAEVGKRLAKQCSRVLFSENRERSQGEVIRLQMKQKAIAALPEHLREAALVPDLTPFPRSRIPASLTPPIQGYIEDRAVAQAQAVTVKKSR